MKEIKFRAKQYGEDGKWVYASGALELADFFYGLSDGQLNSETLGFYTGLRDKENRKIYEGDILSGGSWGEPLKIVWSDKAGGFGCRGSSLWDNMKGYERATIIGNVYENPELEVSYAKQNR